ncbi:coenzyme F420-reducing hydrogenase subunit beta [Haloferula helveola]|uniref:Coenzyme F420-reducing hydrogenase subunit beta n=1 Tax=Haloferula helveola TaxID=490095 RepID=A0ABM7RGB3_9BACT|nr:coenzyme F420-reducing hydrogenase subunit beta [Haloferula helveola]
MVVTESGVEPDFDHGCALPPLAWEACPGKGIDYPDLYRKHYGSLPTDWRVGHVDRLWTGHASDPEVRRTGASGGATSAVLIHLLESGRIDGAVSVKQGIPEPDQASWFIARSASEILACAQSVYVPVSVLDVLPHLVAGERYAMTCVPEQSAALRALQHGGDERAQQVKFVLGPYTGTALDRRAIRSLMRANGVVEDDAVTSLKWRAGEWPGYLEIITESGKVIRSKKVYYNVLIPFFVTQTSLQSMDFANEFTDLSVGDAWSPKFEGLGQGFSVVASRTPVMTEVIEEMMKLGKLELERADVLEASAMHGHMIDFKKRGGYLRNRWREATFRKAPDIGLDPEPLDFPRIAVELVISSIFTVCRTPLARWVMEHIPEKILGPLFNKLRLVWKGASKPAKRKGLRDLEMRVRVPDWKLR